MDKPSTSPLATPSIGPTSTLQGSPSINTCRRFPERPWLGIGGVILRGEEVLLIQRRNEPFAGMWSIPGGIVESGEALRDAVRREMREETGLEVEPSEVIEVYESIGPLEEGRCAFHYVVVDFVCDMIGGSLQAADDATAARWFDRLALPENITSGAPGVVAKAFAWRERATLKS